MTTNRRIQRSLAAILLGVGCAVVAEAKAPAETQARLEAGLKGRTGGLAVAWADADGVEFFSAGKYSDNDRRAITPDTLFEIASLTKVFTALLLAETERAGRVRRDDPVAKYLLPADDRAQAALRPITLWRLATHTAGLPEMPGDFPPLTTQHDNWGRYRRAEMIAAFRKEGLRAPIGSEEKYSNFGVALLGEALGAAWGTGYAPALSEHVLQPLGLPPVTIAWSKGKLPASLALGHVSGRRVATQTFDAFAPAAGMLMSAREMGTFLQFCLGRDDGPLREALRATMQPQAPAPKHAGEVGLGWFIRGLGQARLYWHAGAMGGTRSYLAVWPRGGRAIAIFGNDAMSPEPIALALLELKLAPLAALHW